ncbi:hypothetical protein [Streptomyces coriariae]|uniref:hypothetical protein n=1 Tax=Streptomyces coriariae TaxID=2864460 RepID=UPI001E335DA8|nr:hypothetical protein [Streptomyces coriariae]
MIAAAQLMLILDATITHIALPSIQTELDVSDANLARIVNSHALAFGGLLLGGRAGDLYGRRQIGGALGLAVLSTVSTNGGAPAVHLG